MQTIKRDIYVTKNVLQAPIEVTEGTNSIAIEFDVRDYDIPASAAAVAYSLSTSSMEEPNKALADVSENKITIIPSETFFLPGQNVMQVRIIDGNSKLISFNIIVKCTGKMRFGDEKEEQQSTLVEQMLAKLGEYQKKSASPYNFKGSCLSSELPASGNTINDTYYCTDLKYRKTWNGSAWEQSSLNEADYEDELTKTNGEVSSLKEDLEKIAYPYNYCDIANMTVGKLVNRSDGTLSGNGDGGYIKIPVSVGDTLYVYGFCNDFITNGNVGAVYKEDGTFFQGIYATGDAFILPYTASGYSEVKYALINCKAFGSKMMIFKEPYEDNVHIPYGANVKNIIPNRSNLNDKTVLIEGDSIMYGYGSNGVGIGEILRDRYGFRLYKNAISGSTLAYVEGTENIRDRIVNGVKKPYDYIILDGGYNDYGKSLPLGSLMSGSYPYASTPDATTVIGAMELIFQHIKKNYPKTKIYFVTPHKVNRVWTQVNSLNLTFKDYYDALISVCNLYGVPVIDLWNESGLITYFSEMKVFTKDNDGLHPTKEGYEEFYLPVFQKSLGI